MYVSWGIKYGKSKKKKRKAKGKEDLAGQKSNPTTIRDYRTSGSAAT